MYIYKFENNKARSNGKTLYTIKFVRRQVCVPSKVKDFISLHRLALIMFVCTYAAGI